MENVATISGSETSSRLGRSVGAVLAGLVTVIVTHTGTDAILHALGVFPPAGQVMSGGLFALAATYRILFTVLGGYVTARLAPSKSLKHALVLGSIGSVLALAGMLATLGRGPEFGPLWYPLVLVVTALPTCWLGARIAPPSSNRHPRLLRPQSLRPHHLHHLSTTSPPPPPPIRHQIAPSGATP